MPELLFVEAEAMAGLPLRGLLEVMTTCYSGLVCLLDEGQ